MPQAKPPAKTAAKPKAAPKSKAAAPASARPGALVVGARAPAFSAPLAAGGKISLTALKGRTVILFFYPKDDTTGCTQEAKDFSAHAGDFEALGAVVIGVSPDSLDSHRAFIARHGLTIPLASDIDKTMCTAFGVWVEKSMYGRKYMGVERTTVWIGPDGRIMQVWPKVKVPGHAAAVLAAVSAGARET